MSVSLPFIGGSDGGSRMVLSDTDHAVDDQKMYWLNILIVTNYY